MADSSQDESRVSRWVWMLGWGGAAAVALALTTPWDWLPGVTGLPAGGADAGLDPAALARIEDYREEAVPVSLAGLVIGLAVSALLGLTPLGARLVARIPVGRPWVQRCLAVLAVLGSGLLATLPSRAVGEHLARAAGLSTQSWWAWSADVATGFVLSMALACVVLLSVAGIVARVRRWWLVASLAAGGAVLLSSLAYPLVIEPLYASFTPMPAGPLRTSLLDLAAEDGIDIDDVRVADASARTTAVNAYVSGFGPTRRIVVYDTLLDGPAEQVRLVVAHELGHTADHDVLRGTAIGAAGAVAGFTALTLLAGSSLLRRRSGLAAVASGGSHTVAGQDPARHTLTAVAGVPLLLACYTLATFAVSPVVNTVSRAVEARADVHALTLTGDPDGFVRMQRRLAGTNLNAPSPPAWRQLWFGTHPTPAQRVALAEAWGLQEKAG